MGRVALVAGLAAAALVAVRTLPVDAAVETLRSWVETRGTIGMVGFGASYVVLALLFVPGASWSSSRALLLTLASDMPP